MGLEKKDLGEKGTSYSAETVTPKVMALVWLTVSIVAILILVDAIPVNFQDDPIVVDVTQGHINVRLCAPDATCVA
jgi:hypothetical protein